MFIFTFCSLTTGLLVVNGVEKKFFKEIHEFFAFSFLIIVLIHIAGVIFHQFRHHDGMIFTMLKGEKRIVEGHEGITQQAPIAFVIFLVAAISFMVFLYTNFDPQKQSLTLFGNTLKLTDHEISYTKFF